MKTVRRKPRGFESLSLRHALVAVACAAALFAACARDAGARRLGDYTGQVALVPIPDLLAAPEIHLGKEVAVSGGVSQVCQEMGCWFEISEGGKRLMIDLQMGRRFTIPKEAAGRAARVEGAFVREDGVLKVIGKGMELGRSS